MKKKRNTEGLTDLQKLLVEVKTRLPKGGQRMIARTLNIHPNTVSLALDGFVADDEQNQLIYSEAISIIEDAKLKIK